MEVWGAGICQARHQAAQCCGACYHEQVVGSLGGIRQTLTEVAQVAAVLEMRGEQEQCLSWLERLGALAPTDAGILTRSGAIRAAQVPTHLEATEA